MGLLLDSRHRGAQSTGSPPSSLTWVGEAGFKRLAAGLISRRQTAAWPEELHRGCQAPSSESQVRILGPTWTTHQLCHFGPLSFVS